MIWDDMKTQNDLRAWDDARLQNNARVWGFLMDMGFFKDLGGCKGTPLRMTCFVMNAPQKICL